MRKLINQQNIDNSNPFDYPFGRIRNNTGSGNGTPVNERVYGDVHTNIAKLMSLYGINGNDLPDNETNGYQIIDALIALASKNDFIQPLTLNSGIINIPIKLGFMLENEQVVCKAGFNLGSETQIKGSDNVTFSLTTNGSFLINEYVRLIKTSAGVTIVRLSDDTSLGAMVDLLGYLKATTLINEYGGTINRLQHHKQIYLLSLVVLWV